MKIDISASQIEKLVEAISNLESAIEDAKSFLEREPIKEDETLLSYYFNRQREAENILQNIVNIITKLGGSKNV